MAVLVAKIMDAPTPCRQRKTSSRGKLFTQKQQRQERKSRLSPVRKTRFFPVESASLPKGTERPQVARE